MTDVVSTERLGATMVLGVCYNCAHCGFLLFFPHCLNSVRRPVCTWLHSHDEIREYVSCENFFCFSFFALTNQRTYLSKTNKILLVFDCEELLESSIRSIRNSAAYVVVVYQTVSNFGNPANPFLLKLLNDLKSRGLVDELVQYMPRVFSASEKKKLVSASARFVLIMFFGATAAPNLIECGCTFF